MTKHIKLIYLDQYGPEFRSGYDASCVVEKIRLSLIEYYKDNKVKDQYVTIHKDNLSLCQGICAENLFYSEVKNPPSSKIENDIKGQDEIWLLIKPSKMVRH
jgi:hypothetical protein